MHQKRTMTFTAVACTVAIGAMAQATNPQPTRSSSAMDKVTITGCVQVADEKPIGTSGTAGTASGKFILANASVGTSSKPKTSETMPPSSSAAADATKYRLDGDDSKLKPHVGHKVEITGTVEPTPMAGGGGAAVEHSTPSNLTAPKLKVDSVKMIAAGCSE